jgi:hypothetical protein
MYIIIYNLIHIECKIEIESRVAADSDIRSALDKYKELITKEVESKR